MTIDEERYNQAVSDLVEAFDYEDCEECGKGVEGHVIGPDMFGLPHAWCKEAPGDLDA